MSLPNTILIGAQKAGTTSLYDWLAQHPNIFADKGMKDYNFFANDEIYEEGLKWFEKAFKNHKNEEVILHGHVNYIYFSDISASRIRKLNKNSKIIVVLRDPIQRAYSAYWDAKKVAKENASSFEEAIKKEITYLQDGTLNERATLTYIDHGYYAKQLSIFYNYFEKEQIKIILFDDLVKNSSEVLKETFTFLEVENTFNPNFSVKNEAGLPRSIIIQKILQSIKMPKILRKILPINLISSVKTYLIRNLNMKKVRYPEMDAKIKKDLQKIYTKDIHQLEKMIDKDLSSWLK